MSSARKKVEAVSDTSIDQFCAVTGASRDVARQMLEVCNGNLDLAVDMHMEGPGTSGAGGSGASDAAISEGSTKDDVRAPIPQTQEMLVMPTFGFRGRRRKARSVFDGFRDFQAEAEQQEELMRGETRAKKKRTLEDLFRPPIDITYKGTFESAREAGTTQGKWLMVNIQNVQEFSCQALNRDLWSNSAVKAVVKERFIFWQVYHDSEEGKKYTQFYKINQWPYVAVLDPQTGENLIVWNKLHSASFCDLVAEFLAQQPHMESISTNTEDSSDIGHTNQTGSIVDATEDDQLEAAIQASLTEVQKEPEIDLADSESESDSDLETFTDSDDSIQLPPLKMRRTEKISTLANPSKVENISKTSTVTYISNTISTVTDSAKQTLNPSTSSGINVEKKNSNLTQSSISHTDLGNELKKTIPMPNNKKSSTNSASNTSSELMAAATEENTSSYSQDYKDYLGPLKGPKTTLMFRFPDGKRDQLSIPSTSKLMAVVLYVTSKGYSNERYELVAHFPRRQISHHDFQATLSDIGFHAQETIFVQAR